jgi:hypothetical protein
MIIKKYELTLEGNEYGASGHNLSIDEFNSLKSIDKNLDNISNLIEDYDPWSTNHWNVSKPLNDEQLNLVLKNEMDSIVWNSKSNEYDDIYDHSEKFPEIMKYELWDEFEAKGDAVPCDEQPYILYYQEINRGVIAKFSIESDTIPNPNDFSIVFGSIETEEFEWEYIEKVYYKGKLLEFENIDGDLKEISREFKVYA